MRTELICTHGQNECGENPSVKGIISLNKTQITGTKTAYVLLHVHMTNSQRQSLTL